MGPERAVAYLAVGWLVVALGVLARSLRRGRELADALAARHPQTYEALGRPRPTWLDSVQRDRFARFVGRREFREIADPPLVAEFEAHRRTEVRELAFVLSTLGLVGALVLVVRHCG